MGGFRLVSLPPTLRKIVGALWAYMPNSAAPAGAAPGLRVLPDGCIDLIAELRIVDDTDAAMELVSLYVCGVTDQPSLVNVTRHSAWVGVRFRHGLAGPALGISPPTLLGRQVPATQCAPRTVGLVGQLKGCSTVRQMLATLVAHLESASSAAHLLDRRTAQALELLNGEQGSLVANVAHAVGVSVRTLHRDIVAATGLAPKAFARILRFQRAVERLRSPRAPNLCALAAETGYADQAHLTREIAVLAGITPTALRAAGNACVPHV